MTKSRKRDFTGTKTNRKLKVTKTHLSAINLKTKYKRIRRQRLHSLVSLAEISRMVERIVTHSNDIFLEDRHINYYASKSQREFLENEEIQLPDGFRFEPLKSRDLEDILRDQSLYKNANLELSRLRLEKLPSAAIYHIDSNELACFETVDGIGYIAPRFTRCKYSTFRLCAYVERLIAKKCWSLHGVVPAKSISFQNTFCIDYSDKSPIWTKLLDERGCAIAKQYLILSREPGHQIQFFESCVNW